MLKSIPPYNYTIRPFKAYKTWTIASGSDVVLLDAENTTIYSSDNNVTLSNGLTYNKHSLYGQINSQFYTNVDNPINRIGAKSNIPASESGERQFNDLAKVFSIPNRYVGEGIKRGSLTIEDLNTSVLYTDNTSGSLLSGSVIVGDIFYNQGVVVYTNTASMVSVFTADWKLTHKSTETIYEHEILVSVEPDEFNISTNPSAIYETGSIRSVFVDSDNVSHIVDTKLGTKYIRKKSVLKNGNVLDYRYQSQMNPLVSGGFEHNDLSGSVDVTGSFLTPFVTTIGLYDDNMEMVAVAKLPTPIKNEPNLPINFIIRFDT